MQFLTCHHRCVSVSLNDEITGANDDIAGVVVDTHYILSELYCIYIHH